MMTEQEIVDRMNKGIGKLRLKGIEDVKVLMGKNVSKIFANYTPPDLDPITIAEIREDPDTYEILIEIDPTDENKLEVVPA